MDTSQPYVTHATNIDKIVDKLLNDKYVTPAKIKAFSFVIQALKGISIQEPNEMKAQDNEINLNEEQPVDISEVEGVQLDGEKVHQVKIYKT